MGMYQPANYALDALQGFKGVQDIFSQQAQDKRLEEQSAMQKETHALDVKQKGLAIADAEGTAKLKADYQNAVKNSTTGIVQTSDKAQAGNLGKSALAMVHAAEQFGQAIDAAADPNSPYGSAVPGQAQASPVIMLDRSSSPDRASQLDALTAISKNLYSDRLGRVYDPAAGTGDPAINNGQPYKLGSIQSVVGEKTADGKRIIKGIGFNVTDAEGNTIPGKVVPITWDGAVGAAAPVKETDLDAAIQKYRFMGNVYNTTAQTGKDSHEVARETIKPILDYETAKAIARHSVEKEADVAAHLKQTEGEMAIKRDEKSRTDKSVKAEVDSVAPKLAEIANNSSLSQEQKRAQVAPILAGLSRDAAVIVKETHGVIKDLFPEGKDRKYSMVNTANGVFAVNDNDPKDKTRIGASPTAAGAAGKAAAKTEAEMMADINASFKDYETLAKAYDKRRIDNKDDEAVQQELLTYKTEVLDPKLEALNGKTQEFYNTYKKVYAPGAVPAKKQAVVTGRGADGKEYTVIDGKMYEKPGGMAAPTKVSPQSTGKAIYEGGRVKVTF